ncbi:hypothetical protein [Enterobacter kobei]|uniref:hypothetical protein n=1 Tax=Enterobacter kobei TaxID=208224 RepID=UPI0007963C7A|nr:Uncharacterised protein [Enterobacter kobei]
MKERGMIFNGAMVRAILDGRKMQTRRPVNPQPELTSGSGFSWKGWVYGSGSSDRETNKNFAHVACPFGKPGDRIWVRETFSVVPDHDEPAGCSAVLYAADGEGPYRKWTPSIHMPRWASRILLEITGVRVERLQNISDADCIAEGIIPVPKDRDDDHQFWRDYHLSGDGTFCVHSPRESFESLWKSVRGKSFEQEEDTGPGSWHANPWVWAIKFKRVEEAAQ